MRRSFPKKVEDFVFKDSNFNDDKESFLTVRNTFSGVGAVGVIASLLTHPFIAQAGMAKGWLAHAMIGTGTTIGAAAYTLRDGAICAVVGAGVGLILFKKPAAGGYLLGLAGGVFGMVEGGIEGYAVSSKFVGAGVSQFAANAEQVVLAAPKPALPKSAIIEWKAAAVKPAR